MPHGHPPRHRLPLAPARATVQDPVCGMLVAADAPLQFAHEGVVYRFCCTGCRDRFAAAPKSFIGKAPAFDHHHAPPETTAPTARATKAGVVTFVCPMDPDVRQDRPGACPKCGMALEPEAQTAPATRVEWTCPMHPEIVRDSPGACPTCGMALEPRTVELVEAESPELVDMRRRLWPSAILSVTLVVIAMTHMLPFPWAHTLAGHGARPFIELALATPVVLYGGLPFFARAVTSVRNRSLNMFTLIGLGVAVAFGYSVIASVLPGVFPAAFRDENGNVGVYFEAAAVIVTLVLVGQVLELQARSRTGAAVRALLQLAPKFARRLRADGSDEDIPVSEIRAGDRLRVRPGEKLPADGIVVEGTTAIDESMLTGESAPVARRPGDKVIAGSVNGTGGLVMRADRVDADTVLAQIVKLVGDAQRSRAPVQRLVDRVSAIFVPSVIAMAVLAFGVWAIWGPEPRLAHALVNAVAVLIVACPCALGLATPMSIMVAVGKGASIGVLFKNAEALELLHRFDTLIVDKTGTLTEGRPRVVSVHAVPGQSETTLLTAAASLERNSEHPLASAVVTEAHARGLRPPTVEAFESITGQGVKGLVNGQAVLVGNTRLMESNAIAVDAALAHRVDGRREDGQTVVYVAIAGQLVGVLGIADPVKANAAEAIAGLRAAGVRIVMLTGDNRATAAAVGRAVGIDDLVAEVLPAQKAREVQRLRDAGHVVAMAGDGVNDAPALALAHVGIAMGTGTDVAIESAHVTLVRGDLRGILRARRLSRAAISNIRQNLFFAFFYNAIGIPVAAGVLYPFFGVLLSPMFAAAAMALSSVSVIGNALRLRRVPLDPP